MTASVDDFNEDGWSASVSLAINATETVALQSRAAMRGRAVYSGGSGCGLNPLKTAGCINTANCDRLFALVITSTVVTAESERIASWLESLVGGGCTTTTGLTCTRIGLGGSRS